MNKRITGVVLFILVFVLYRFIPASDSFTSEQISSLALLLLCIIMWFTEFVPIGVSAVFILALPTLMNICTLKETLPPFANPILFFVIATFALSAALNKVPLAKRILLFLLRRSGNSVNKFVFAVMSATFIISSIMSNIPATAIFIPICISFLDLYDTTEEKRSCGAAMMIALAVSGMVGGIITPAGSSNNLLSLSILEEYAGVSVRFIDWMLICAPIAVVILPITWWFVIKIFKPKPLKKERIESFIEELKTLEKPSYKEYIVIADMLLMIALWIMSSWFPVLNVNIISICGMLVMFLPGIDIFDWKHFVREVSWSVVIMIGSILCLGNILLKSGIGDLLAKVFFTVDAGMSPAMIILKLSLFVSVMQLIIPNGPGVITALGLPVIVAAQNIGLNPAILSIALCILASWTIILPLSAVPMVTYSTGYYKITDIGKVGVPILVVVTLVMMVWIPFITNIIVH